MSSADEESDVHLSEEEDEEPVLKYENWQQAQDKLPYSSLAVSRRLVAVGTHGGTVSVFDWAGKSKEQGTTATHSTSVLALAIDSAEEYVASASLDGQLLITPLTNTSTSSSDVHTYNLGRPLRCLAFEPDYGKRKVKQIVSGGMAGVVTLHERGWLGQKETLLHSGEGPIWSLTWRSTLIAWANDEGVRIYDTKSAQHVAHIPIVPDSPRPDLFRYTLAWQDDKTLIIAQGSFIKTVHIKEREKKSAISYSSSTQLYAETQSIFQIDCMISGLVMFEKNSFLVLAYLSEDAYSQEATEDREEQKRKASLIPELRIISEKGEELSSDALNFYGHERFGCNDYSLQSFRPSTNTSTGSSEQADISFVLSPRDIVIVKPRDQVDHIHWLIEQGHFHQALVVAQSLPPDLRVKVNVKSIGMQYLQSLIDAGNLEKAAESCSDVLDSDSKAWEDVVFLFIEKGRIDTIIPYVPVPATQGSKSQQQLSHLVYEMILAHFLRSDPNVLLDTIRKWPTDIYHVPTIISALEDELASSISDRNKKDVHVHALKEGLADLYMINKQYAKALPLFLELKRPGALELIKEHNLFTTVQDRVVMLIEYDLALEKRQGKLADVDPGTEDKGRSKRPKHGFAIDLLASHTHSIPIPRVTKQLQGHRKLLYMYLDVLFDNDPQSAPEYADEQVDLYAEYEPTKLMDFWKASSAFNLDKAYNICVKRDLVPEMVFLLARMGNSKKALSLIIERVGNVQEAIDFVKRQNENDLWEDLLGYSESRPDFIKGLLYSVGADIDPIRLIRRIRNGLEIDGLRDALVKILQDYNLQISLIEGCESILQSDCRQLSLKLYQRQRAAFFGSSDSVCYSCRKQLYHGPQPPNVPTSEAVVLIFLCRHVFHPGCAFPSAEANLPSRFTLHNSSMGLTRSSFGLDPDDVASDEDADFRNRLRFLAELKSKVYVKCPICEAKGAVATGRT